MLRTHTRTSKFVYETSSEIFKQRDLEATLRVMAPIAPTPAAVHNSHDKHSFIESCYFLRVNDTAYTPILESFSRAACIGFGSCGL